MNTLLKKTINKEEIIDKDIEDELFEVCDREHASCNNECPVYEKFCPDKSQSWECPYFKNGKKMLEALRRKDDKSN